MSMNDWC